MKFKKKKIIAPHIYQTPEGHVACGEQNREINILCPRQVGKRIVSIDVMPHGSNSEAEAMGLLLGELLRYANRDRIPLPKEEYKHGDQILS